jgi:hypothetical protein
VVKDPAYIVEHLIDLDTATHELTASGFDVSNDEL